MLTGSHPVADPLFEPEAIATFGEVARRAIYDVIALRRDVRHFRPDSEIDEEALWRILGAAHLAPSVGFSQPWGFVLVRNRAQRERIRESFLRCRRAEAARFPPGRREQYLAHRLEGILEAPLNICVAVDLRSRGEAILGTTAQPEAVRASACCAVQNLWLAARAEGIGVGWVSIVEPAVLRTELALPPGVEPIAYLCVGHPIAFRARPMLEETGWDSRRPLENVVHPGGHWRDAAETREQITLAPSASLRGRIPAFSEEARAAALAHQKLLTKPPGSLGRLEEIAAWYAGARGRFPGPAPRQPVLAIFAADHGVASEGVSAYGSQVTAAMAATVMAGGAAINVIAAQHGVRIELIDVGIAGDLSALPREAVIPLTSARVRAGTRNLRSEPALTRAETQAALTAGSATATHLAEQGVDLIAVGEIGIANTTPAAALACAFTGLLPGEIVGAGTGVSDDALAHKIAVVEGALALHRPDPADPLGVLASVGGLEIAAMAGCMLEAARLRMPVVIDGFIASAAALAAAAIDSGIRPFLLAAHASAEKGASAVLRQLGLNPLLDLGLRLGEGTGAAIAVGLVRTAVVTQLSMATFATAGIVGRVGTPVEDA
jgi:nicotinate-nucleotide--dimethylbenzimidazole phosphoribosyltransferase